MIKQQGVGGYSPKKRDELIQILDQSRVNPRQQKITPLDSILGRNNDSDRLDLID